VGSRLDVAIVGAGPAGLAVAIASARRGLSVAVFERSEEVADKACGEGVMPPGVRALAELGLGPASFPGECRTFRSIRYVDGDGTSAEGALPGEALAVRRVALVRAMVDRAREVGADLRFGCALASHRRVGGAMQLESIRGQETAAVLVAADGLGSHLRQAEGLEVRRRGWRRFGLRRHFHRCPWTSAVEIHLGQGAEAYVTPVADDCVGVAFLWGESEKAARPDPVENRWQELLRKFPRLRHLLDGAPAASKLRGAGPFERSSRTRVLDRFALVGDAAGYVDAITGEGISLSLLSAAALARVLPDAITRGADRTSLAPYDREYVRLFRRYAFLTRSVLAIVRRPRVRRSAVLALRRSPAMFDWLLAKAIGSSPDNETGQAQRCLDDASPT
jgi:flavin-dependent dehydrogenase